MERAEILYRRGDEYLAQLNDIKDFVLYASAELKA